MISEKTVTDEEMVFGALVVTRNGIQAIRLCLLLVHDLRRTVYMTCDGV